VDRRVSDRSELRLSKRPSFVKPRVQCCDVLLGLQIAANGRGLAEVCARHISRVEPMLETSLYVANPPPMSVLRHFWRDELTLVGARLTVVPLRLGPCSDSPVAVEACRRTVVVAASAWLAIGTARASAAPRPTRRRPELERRFVIMPSRTHR
jgi:hypothetical protein